MAEIVITGGTAGVLAIPCDVANAHAVFAAADRIEAELGPIDTWINDAMTTVFGRFQQLTPEQSRASPRSPIWASRGARGPRSTR
jgi:NAD(P)-dependent dehydrogenase (short-subunit alcohol dehydrogenase family)